MEEQKRKIYSPEEALEKIKKYCAYQERAQQEVRDKLYSYGLHQRQVENLIAQLVTENFLNEERFALAFASGKFNIVGWGRIKIKMELQRKKISAYCINKALYSLDGNKYELALRKIIQKKFLSVKEKNLQKKNYQVARYAISRGFEPDMVWDQLRMEEN